MATHDYILDNQVGLSFRQDLNAVLAAIVSQNSSATAPTPTYAGMPWLDTASDPPILKRRNQADSGWELLQVDEIDGLSSTLSNLQSNDIRITSDNVLCPHRNLVISMNSATPNSKVDIDADALVLYTAANAPIKVSSVNLTVDITASGANGLDTGTEVVSTWYHLWVISNGTTTSGLMSTSATAPTMPSGYTYKGYVGAVYNGLDGNFTPIYQRNSTVSSSNSTFAISLTATSRTSVSLATVVPTTATRMLGAVGLYRPAAGSFIALYTNSADLIGSSFIETPVASAQSMTTYVEVPIIIAQTLYYLVGNADTAGKIACNGWVY